MKLLLAEDNPADARLVREMLIETPGATFELLHVARLGAAIEKMRREPVEEVLLDLGLPDSQGMQTLIRMQEANATVPIVVLTGLNDQRFAEEILRAGAQDYLVKGSFGSELLVRTIRYAAERKRAEEKIRHLAAVVDCCNDAIISATLDGRILSWNAGAERIYGYSAAEMLGASIEVVVPPSRVAEAAGLIARVSRGELVQQHETVRQRKAGDAISVALTYSPLRDANGRVVAVSVIGSDITARKQAEQELLRSHEELTRFNQMAVGRELRIVELKQQVNALAGELGRTPPFRLDFLPAATAPTPSAVQVASTPIPPPAA